MECGCVPCSNLVIIILNFTGGLGGYAGKHLCINTGAIEEKIPKFVAKDGVVGRKGGDTHLCRSLALDFKVNGKTIEIRGHRGVEFRLSDPIYIDSERCPTQYLKTNKTKKPRDRKFKFTPSLIEYKTLLRKYMKKSPLAKTIQKAYEAFDSNPEINRAYTVIDLVVEANALERQFFELNECVAFLPMYGNLLKRIESCAVVIQPERLVHDRVVLVLLFTTILSKTLSMRSGHESDLIIDIEKFFDLITQNIKKLDEAARVRVIEEHRNKYNEDLRAKIDEANDYIARDIQPEIEQLFSMLDVEMQKVVEETIALEEKTIKEIQRKEEIAKIIRRNSMIRLVTGVLGMVGTAVSFLGPAGAFAAAAIGTGSGVINALLVDPEMNTLEMPPAVKNAQNGLSEKLEKNNREKFNAIEMEMHKMYKSLSRVTATNYILEQLRSLMSKAESIKSNHPIIHDDIELLFREFSELVQAHQKFLMLRSESDTKADYDHILKIASNALAVIDSSVRVYQQFAADDKKLDAVGKAINADRNTLVALKAFEKQIYDELIPMIDVLHNHLDAVEKNLGGKSSVALDVQQWKVHDTLRSVQNKLIDSVKGFQNEYGIEDCFVKIDEAINLIIRIYDRMQNYQEQSKLVIYLSDLHLAGNPTLNIGDAQLRDNLHELCHNLQANYIMSQYNRAIGGFKQAVFPFAAEYLEFYRLPETLDADKNLSIIVTAAADKIKTLSERMTEFNRTVINENDALIHNAHFDRDSVGNQPFYVWPNDEIRHQIEQLFAGKKIYLLADVMRSSRMNAVKFNIVGLEFRASNQSANDQLKQLREFFHVSLTHMGESNYRCDQQFYTISSRPRTIYYSFSQKNQEPVIRNVVYDKLRAGVKLLSPYTLWGIQLSKGPFDELKPFADFVDIELHGYGQYVAENAAICNTDLDKYYSTIMSIR